MKSPQLTDNSKNCDNSSYMLFVIMLVHLLTSLSRCMVSPCATILFCHV